MRLDFLELEAVCATKDVLYEHEGAKEVTDLVLQKCEIEVLFDDLQLPIPFFLVITDEVKREHVGLIDVALSDEELVLVGHGLAEEQGVIKILEKLKHLVQDKLCVDEVAPVDEELYIDCVEVEEEARVGFLLDLSGEVLHDCQRLGWVVQNAVFGHLKEAVDGLVKVEDVRVDVLDCVDEQTDQFRLAKTLENGAFHQSFQTPRQVECRLLCELLR